MLVDDQAEYLEWVNALLSADPSFRVEAVAHSGPEALTLADRKLLELAVVDVAMPGMNGFDTVRRLLARHPDLLIVLTSSQDEPAYHQLSELLGVHFLAKSTLSPQALRALFPDPE